MPNEKIGDTVDVTTANHPPRTDSPEYLKSRGWLMKTPGGCYICGGPVDLSHPEASPAIAKQMQDHHGGGLYVKGSLVGFNLAPLEWSMGWGADPVKLSAFIEQLFQAGLTDYDQRPTTVAEIMQWVDSVENANVKLCAPHHVGHQTQHTPDVNGHEAVGIHNAPWPILAAQAVWDWSKGDMWGGTTGTIAVAPHPDGSGKAVVTYVHHSHPTPAKVGDVLPATHPHARAVHTPVTAAA